MRLRRIEAVRFGRLDGRTLDGLGDGLTVVLGPNEAGKTSFTTLVRHVLYGFPTPAKPRAYVSAAGAREGRLVFSDADGEWVLQRTEGVRGGQLTVRALSGSERPNLSNELTRGVSEAAFGTVFGFGLDEMAQIEVMRGSHDDIVSRLYAAGAGLAVSPQDVRATVDDRAAKLFAPRAKTPVINALLSELKDARDRIRTLEASAEEYADDVERLRQLREEVGRAAETRDAALERHRALTYAAERVAEWEREIEGAEVERAQAEDQASRLDAKIAALGPVEDAGTAGTGAAALLGELPLFEQRLRSLRERESRHRAAGRSIDAALLDIQMTREQALAADISPQTAAEIETRRDRLLRLEERTESARIAVLQAREQATERADAAAGPGFPWAAFFLGVFGLGLVVYGAIAGDVVQIALGAVALVAGIAFAIASRMRVRTAINRDSRGLATGALATSPDALAAELEAARAEWRAWIAGRGFPDASGEPGSAATLFAALKDIRSDLREAEGLASEIVEDYAWLEGYRTRLGSAVEAVGVAAPASLDDVVAAAARARAAGEGAAGRIEARRELDREREALAERQASVRTRIDAIAARVRETLERWDVTDAATLQGAMGGATIASEEAIAAHESVATEASAIAERVRSEERERGMATLRFEIEGAEERLRQAAEEYAVCAVASRMLDRAQERYEREQQPEVVREAERIFADITGGRYPRLKVPLDSSPIAVFDAVADERRTDHLSRGTAEQLYLALRLALVSQLGEVGSGLPVLMDDILVNFDPERRNGAAGAIVDVARQRQVIVFTCHPETADLLAEVDPTSVRVLLDRC